MVLVVLVTIMTPSLQELVSGKKKITGVTYAHTHLRTARLGTSGRDAFVHVSKSEWKRRRLRRCVCVYVGGGEHKFPMTSTRYWTCFGRRHRGNAVLPLRVLLAGVPDVRDIACVTAAAPSRFPSPPPQRQWPRRFFIFFWQRPADRPI